MTDGKPTRQPMCCCVSGWGVMAYGLTRISPDARQIAGYRSQRQFRARPGSEGFLNAWQTAVGLKMHENMIDALNWPIGEGNRGKDKGIMGRSPTAAMHAAGLDLHARTLCLGGHRRPSISNPALQIPHILADGEISTNSTGRSKYEKGRAIRVPPARSTRPTDQRPLLIAQGAMIAVKQAKRPDM